MGKKRKAVKAWAASEGVDLTRKETKSLKKDLGKKGNLQGLAPTEAAQQMGQNLATFRGEGLDANLSEQRALKKAGVYKKGGYTAEAAGELERMRSQGYLDPKGKIFMPGQEAQDYAQAGLEQFREMAQPYMQGRAVPTLQGAQMDTAGADEIRARQMALIQALEAQAAGTGGPTAAQMQLQRGLDAQRAQQASMAAGATGANRALAQRMAAQNMAQAGQETVGQAAVLRAQEQQAAQNALAQAQAQMRGADLQTAQAQAALQQQTAMGQAELAQKQRAMDDAIMMQMLGFGQQQDLSTYRGDIDIAGLMAGQYGQMAARQAQPSFGEQLALTSIGAGLGAAGQIGGSFLKPSGGGGKPTP